jgi:hypothetical protein
MNGQGDMFDEQPPESDLSFEQLLAMSQVKASLCPSCSRVVKVYKFKLGAYSRLLIWMKQVEWDYEDRWIHVPRLAPDSAIDRGGDYGKLRHWGFIELRPNPDDPAKRTSGIWRLTEKGRKFVANGLWVPTHVFFRAKSPEAVVLGFHEDLTTIVPTLGVDFNYRALMDGEW